MTVNCPACENSQWVGVYKIDPWSIRACSVCGLARIDPLPVNSERPELYSRTEVVRRDAKKRGWSRMFFNRLKHFYKTITKRDKNEIFYKKFSRYLSRGSKILDIGCGDGRFLRRAKSHFKCSGVEISEYLAGLARTQGDIKVAVGDFLEVDLDNEKYDGISLISLIEHLNDPKAAVRKCFSHLNDGGVLLLKTVNYGCLNRKFKRQKWTGFRPPDHIYYFTPENLQRLLASIGFRRVKISASPLNDNFYCDAWK